MPPTRPSCPSLQPMDPNLPFPKQKKKPGPKPKPLSERKNYRTTPIQRVERSYTKHRKLQVLAYLENTQNHSPDPLRPWKGDYRKPTYTEASAYFQIPRATTAGWVKPYKKKPKAADQAEGNDVGDTPVPKDAAEPTSASVDNGDCQRGGEEGVHVESAPITNPAHTLSDKENVQKDGQDDIHVNNTLVAVDAPDAAHSYISLVCNVHHHPIHQDKTRQPEKKCHIPTLKMPFHMLAHAM